MENLSKLAYVVELSQRPKLLSNLIQLPYPFLHEFHEKYIKVPIKNKSEKIYIRQPKY